MAGYYLQSRKSLTVEAVSWDGGNAYLPDPLIKRRYKGQIPFTFVEGKVLEIWTVNFMVDQIPIQAGYCRIHNILNDMKSNLIEFYTSNISL